MKRILAATAALGLLAATAHATVYVFDFENINAPIPDGNPIGYANTQTLSGLSEAPISDVVVRLNISGGFNGDLYGYVAHDSGFAVLLNRVGTSGSDVFGYANPGFGPDVLGNPFRLSDAGLQDVHQYQLHAPEYNGLGQLTGTWRPDGGSFESFHGLNANGTWTLFLADLAFGDESGLLSWGVEITVVPEPGNLMLIGLLFGGGILLWRRSWKS